MTDAWIPQPPPAGPFPPPTGAPARRKIPVWAIILLGVVAVCCCLATAAGAWFAGRIVFSRVPLQVELEYPRQTPLGEDVELIVLLTNNDSVTLNLVDVAIDSTMELDLLEGVAIIDTEPASRVDREARVGKPFYYFEDIRLKPGAAQTLRFHLRPLRPGKFEGMIIVDAYRDCPDCADPQSDVRHTEPVTLEMTILPAP